MEEFSENMENMGDELENMFDWFIFSFNDLAESNGFVKYYHCYLFL